MGKHEKTDQAFTKNTADKRQLKEAKDMEYVAGQRYREDISKVLENFEGRRLVWRWLGYCRLDETSYVERNSNAMVFNEGMRNVGLRLKSELIENAPKLWQQMEQEAIGGKYE